MRRYHVNTATASGRPACFLSFTPKAVDALYQVQTVGAVAALVAVVGRAQPAGINMLEKVKRQPNPVRYALAPPRS